MRRIPSIQLLVVSEQLPVRLLAVDVLIDRAAQCHGEHLYTPTDTQHRNLPVVSQTDKQQFGQITFVVDTVQLRNRFFAGRLRPKAKGRLYAPTHWPTHPGPQKEG